MQYLLSNKDEFGLKMPRKAQLSVGIFVCVPAPLRRSWLRQKTQKTLRSLCMCVIRPVERTLERILLAFQA